LCSKLFFSVQAKLADSKETPPGLGYIKESAQAKLQCGHQTEQCGHQTAAQLVFETQAKAGAGSKQQKASFNPVCSDDHATIYRP
jgi:hypothetical protein